MNGSFVTPEFRDRVRARVLPIATGFGRVGLTPNALTVIGFIGTCVAAVAAASQAWLVAGVAVGCFAGGFGLGVLLAGLAATFASGVTYTRAKAESLGVKGDVGVAPRPERLVILAAGLVLADILGGVAAFDCGNLFCVGPQMSGGVPALAIALGLITILSAITVLQRIVHVKRQLGNEQ